MDSSIKELEKEYDYIVVDTPKTFSPVALTGVEASSELYLLTTADLQSLRNVTRCLPLLRQIAERKEKGWLKLVVNRYDSRQLISLDEVEKTLRLEVFATLRNDYRAVMESINEGRPSVMDGKSPYAQDVRAIAARVVGLVPAGPDDGSGLLSRFLGAFRGGKEASVRESPKNQVKTSG